MTAQRSGRSRSGGRLADAQQRLHEPRPALPSLLFPLFFFTAFAGGLSRSPTCPASTTRPATRRSSSCFVLLQSAAFGGVFTGFGIARDFESGFARRLLLAAPQPERDRLGYALAALVRWLFTATVLTVVALAAGMEVDGGRRRPLRPLLLALLINVAACCGRAGVAMRLRTMQAGPLMQMPVFLLLFFAPVYVPLALLTGWIDTLATVNPLT